MSDVYRPRTKAKLAWGSLVYVIFVGLGSIAPLFLQATAHYNMGVFDFEIVMTGDLLLISMVISIASLGDLAYIYLAGHDEFAPRPLVFVMAVGQGGVLAVGLLKYLSATVPVGDTLAGALHAGSVAVFSYWVYGLAVLIGWSTLMLRTVAEDKQ